MAGLTIGPLLFHWSPEQRRDFYDRIAGVAAIDTVYLGEVVCSKRIPFFAGELPQVAERLSAAGKKVVLSTLSEVTVPADRRAVRDICAETGFEIEVNDMAALWELDGRPCRIGQLLNCYNEETLRFLHARGATHVCLPPELPAPAIRAMAATAAELGIGVEVQVFGRVSLALSARCYHARAHGRTKTDCRFVCDRDPDGLDLTTVEGTEFLSINGIQTLSHTYLNLTAELAELQRAGVSQFRLSPHTCDMVEAAAIFAELAEATLQPDEADRRLAALLPQAAFANGFYHGKAGYLRC
jgi:collagenase-like PrtC family protease